MLPKISQDAGILFERGAKPVFGTVQYQFALFDPEFEVSGFFGQIDQQFCLGIACDGLAEFCRAIIRNAARFTGRAQTHRNLQSIVGGPGQNGQIADRNGWLVFVGLEMARGIEIRSGIDDYRGLGLAGVAGVGAGNRRIFLRAVDAKFRALPNTGQWGICQLDRIPIRDRNIPAKGPGTSGIPEDHFIEITMEVGDLVALGGYLGGDPARRLGVGQWGIFHL